MSSPKFRLTSRLQQIFKKAESEAINSKDRVLRPEHILIACLSEKGGALGELALHVEISLDLLRDDTRSSSSNNTVEIDFFHCLVSEEVAKVLEVSIGYMNRYNQIFINEGHVLKALMTTKVLEHCLTEETRELILTLATTSRDMITHLGNYTFPILNTEQIRKVNLDDEKMLVTFVEENFSEEWASTIKGAFMLNNPTVYVASSSNGSIVGFAAYDVYQNKKGYFGPMGVVTSNRTKGVGYSLLHHCLRDMKEAGYEYAIIGGAGPIEFYEKACNAVVIPLASKK